jgi:hypothetical protein
MTIRAARVVGGVIINVIVVEALPAPEIEALAPGELIECPEEVGIGWGYNPAKLPNQWEPPVEMTPLPA